MSRHDDTVCVRRYVVVRSRILFNAVPDALADVHEYAAI